MRPQDLLRFHSFIGALGQRDAEELMKQAITRRFQVNDVIFRKDDPGTGLYGVVSGRVVVADSAEGKELILNVFGPGEYFGEIALLDGEGQSATANTHEPSELLFLDRMQFMPFLTRSPEATTRARSSRAWASWARERVGLGLLAPACAEGVDGVGAHLHEMHDDDLLGLVTAARGSCREQQGDEFIATMIGPAFGSSCSP